MEKNIPVMNKEAKGTTYPLVLESYNPVWSQWYEEEKKNILRVIQKANIIRINHVGSTSVPGMVSRPIIDILLEIKNKCNLDGLIEMLEEIGYVCEEKMVYPSPHMIFKKGYLTNGYDERVFHIYIRFKGDWDELYFRDYLILHEDVAIKYSNLKKTIKNNVGDDEITYRKDKANFIDGCILIARKEFWHKYL